MEARHAREATPRRSVYVMRHGIKQDNIPGRLNFELELLPEGLDGCQALQTFFEAHHIQFGMVLVSPWLRCRQTAAVVAPHVSAVPEPGLSEVLTAWNGLRGSSLDAVVARVQSMMDAAGVVPLVSTSELRQDADNTFPRTMSRAACFVQRLTDEQFVDGPLLLVTHGGTAVGIIEALLTGSEGTWDKARLPDMGSVTHLEHADGRWFVVGSAVPVRNADGAWDCRWSRGTAVVGDAFKL